MCTYLSPGSDHLRGTVAQYNNPGSLEPSLMISGRADTLMNRQKLDIITGNQINSFELATSELQPSWICLISRLNEVTVQYNDELFEFKADNAEIISGGVLTAGIGIHGNLTNTFLVDSKVTFEGLDQDDLCFNSDQIIASLSPNQVITKTGEPLFVEKWGNWNDWGDCSVSCGGGLRFRIRQCLGGTPGVGNCVGDFSQSQVCMSQQCGAGWRQWSQWSTCSNSCDEGQQIRIRECLGNNGACESGDTTESRACFPENIDQKGKLTFSFSNCD